MRSQKSRVRSQNWFVLACSLALFLSVSLLHAGETGKVVGRVQDQSTGEPVIGAAVEIEGTELGEATDENGRYSILSAPAGTWNITVSAVGYSTTTKTDLLIQADQTTTADFKLKSTVIQINDVVEVKAERAMVIRTAVQTTRSMDAKDFARLPVNALSALVGLAAGVQTNQARGWTHIRGGRYNDVSYLIDGVSAKDALVGTLWSSPKPTTENIAAVEVITGSFDAEYGEAMSGVIQTITKEGGAATSAKLRYTTDEMFPGKDLNFGYNLVQATLGGPLFINPLRYFVSGEYFKVNDSREALYQVKQPRAEYTIEGKVNYNLPKGLIVKDDNLKVILDGHHSDYEWQTYANSWKYHLSGLYANRVRSYKANARLNYLPGGSTLVELAAGIFDTRLLRSPQDYLAESEDTLGMSGFLRKNGIWNRMIFKSEQWVFNNPVDSYVTRMNNRDTVIRGHMPVDVAVLRLYEAYRMRPDSSKVYDKWLQSYAFYANPYGVPGLFVTEGDNRTFHFRSTYTRYAKGSVTLTPNQVHEVKTGFELKWFDLKEYTNSLPWDPNPFYENYNYKPFTAAAYLQDKADFEDLVVRAGVRLDLLNAQTKYRVFPESIGGSPGVRDSMEAVSLKWRVSPRLGLSYPITDRIKFRFSYGHFFRNPDFSDLYASQMLAEELARRGNLIVGNPNMSAEKTIGYEMGFDAQLTDVFEFDFTAFFKDVFDLSGVRPVPALPQSYTLYYNVEYARIKGFEATMAKALSDYWSAKLSYTFTIAKGTASTATDQYLVDNPIQVDYYLDQDQRHGLSFDLGFSTGRTFAWAVLRDFDASAIARFGSGLPYTPTNVRGERTGEENSARMPNTFSVDGRLSKTVKLGKVGINLVCDVFNLLNAKQVLTVFAATGKPDFTGRIIMLNEFSASGYLIGDPAYHPGRDANHDGFVTRQEKYDSYVAAYKDLNVTPLNFGASRKIRFGLSVGF
jgi:outer membrane receptor protein involved in Fe transport